MSYFTYGYGRNTLVYNSTESNGSTDADYVEYGEQQSVINGIGAHWRVLASTEWHYLLFERTMFFGAPRFASTILTLSDGRTKIPGMLLYPDRYPVNDPTNHPITTDVDGLTAAVPQFNPTSWSNWQKMEQQGCVFLPATGCRSGATIFYTFEYTYPNGAYYNYHYRLVYPSSTNDPAYVFSESESDAGNSHSRGITVMTSVLGMAELPLAWAYTIRMAMDEEYGDGTLYN